MKPFDLEAAKRGEPIVDNYGESMKFVAHVPEAQPEYRLVCIGEDRRLYTYTDDGRVGRGSPTVLFMAPKKHTRTVYVNFYLDRDGAINMGTPYPTHEGARAAINTDPDWRVRHLQTMVITVKWEE